MNPCEELVSDRISSASRNIGFPPPGKCSQAQYSLPFWKSFSPPFRILWYHIEVVIKFGFVNLLGGTSSANTS